MTASAETVFAVQQALQRPIAFHRVFAQIGGGLVPGLFLSQLWYWHGRGSDPDWTHKTIDEWTEETGLSRKEQDRAKRELVGRGLISIEKRGVPCRCYFRLNMPEIIEKIASNPNGYPVCPKRTNKNVPMGQTSLSQTDKQECPDGTNKLVPNGQTLYKETETTQRLLTETTHRETSATKIEAQWTSFPDPVEQECHQLVSKNALPSFDQVSSLIPVYADYVAYLAWIKKDSESWANNWQAFARKQVQDLVRGSGNSTVPRWKAGELPGQAANSPQKTGLSRDQINAIFDEIDGAA
jgi:hypothetical protein